MAPLKGPVTLRDFVLFLKGTLIGLCNLEWAIEQHVDLHVVLGSPGVSGIRHLGAPLLGRTGCTGRGGGD